MQLFINILVTLICMPWPALIMMSPMMIAAPNFSNEKSSILVAFVFFIYPSFVFLVLKLIGYTFYGTDPYYWTVAVVAVGILASLAFKLPTYFINLLNGVSNTDYFVSANAVYLNGTKISGADPKTFVHFPDSVGYSKDAQYVYRQTKRFSEADATTFGPVANDNTRSYWYDKNNVYHDWKKITGADGASFIGGGTGYAFDKNYVYYQNQRIESADRATFIPFNNYIGRDDNNVYIRAVRSSTAIDIASFEVIETEESIFAKDKAHFFILRYHPTFDLEPFPNVDIVTFETIGNYYAKDKNQVYNYHYFSNTIKILKDASAATFKIEYNNAFNTDATDGTHFYKAGELYEDVIIT